MCNCINNECLYKCKINIVYGRMDNMFHICKKKKTVKLSIHMCVPTRTNFTSKSKILQIYVTKMSNIHNYAI